MLIKACDYFAAGLPLVNSLGRQMDWAVFTERLGQACAATNGAPGVNTLLLVALRDLKYQHELSDEAVVQQWIENPYWQHFSGEQFFQHERQIDPSSMTRWRQRLGEAGAACESGAAEWNPNQAKL